MANETRKYGVVIVGSGPVGCAFARRLIDLDKKEGFLGDRKILMLDAGAQHSRHYGEHQKNSFLYQRNIDEFVHVIKGNLHPLSVSTRGDVPVTLDPSSFRYDGDTYEGFTLNNQNPHQREVDNLGACAATYAVGGMATHWTCALPEFHPVLERTWTDEQGKEHTYPISDQEMKHRYETSAGYFRRSTEEFRLSARQQLVKKVLRQDGDFDVTELPLGATRRQDGNARGDREFVHWSAADTVLGDELKDPAKPHPKFELWPEHQVTRLDYDLPEAPNEEVEITSAHVRDLRNLDNTYTIKADAFIVACGPILTAQLLYASDIDESLGLPVGRYLTEQPMAFCQVVLRQEYLDGLEGILDKVAGDSRDVAAAQKAKVRVAAYRAEQAVHLAENQRSFRKRAADPIPFPKGEPEPNLAILAAPNRPWHCQIHRDAFSYGAVPPNIDTRLIVDLRWFGLSRPRRANRVEFSAKKRNAAGAVTGFHNVDSFDMPQPTFHFQLSDAERRTAGLMMADMKKVASYLGGFMPGSEPQFLTPGLPLHVGGTTRMGHDADEGATSVVNPMSRVWRTRNLWLGGNGLHPYGNAGNPTHTSVAMAVKAVDQDIVNRLKPVK